MVPVGPVASMDLPLPTLPLNDMVRQRGQPLADVALIAPPLPPLPVNSMAPIAPPLAPLPVSPISPMHPPLPLKNNLAVPVDPVAPLHPPLPLNNLALPPLPDYFMVPLAPNQLPLGVTHPSGSTDMGAMEIADGAVSKGSDGGMSFDIDDDYSYGSIYDFLAAGGGVDQDFPVAADVYVGPVAPVLPPLPVNGPLVDDEVTCVDAGAPKVRYRPYVVSVCEKESISSTIYLYFFMLPLESNPSRR